ncbi:MAG: VanZ family protein [Oscillospiraceae bacterium]|nr:VanZ family protein [Oscillospiraceae bacterium]MBQ7129501.1 VanZ family protein [Oscillospiraceae bacterium]
MYRLFLAGLDAAVASILVIPVFLILNRFYFHNRKKTVFYTVFAVYLAGVYLVVGLPSVIYIRFEPNVNLIPFLDIFSNLSETLLNVILFLPLGFLTTVLWKPFRNAKQNILFGFCVSLAIEILQMFTFRATDVNDLITNTLGSLIGWCIGSVFLKRFPGTLCDGRKADTAIVFSAVFGIMFFIHPFIAPLIWDLFY